MHNKILFYVVFIILLVMPSTVALGSISRVALVTGSNKGIGFEIAKKIGSEKGMKCILGCRNEELGKLAVEALEKEGCDVSFLKLDLEDLDSIHNAVNTIRDTYGKCDVLVNNAAVCFNDPTLYGKVPHTPFAKQAEITVKTNFQGTLALTQALLPILSQSDSPRIINIASSAGRLTILPSEERRDQFSSNELTLEELEGYMREFVVDAQNGSHLAKGWPNTGYGVSKVGIIAMTRILAREHPKIMVNSVDPGYCRTDQNNNQGFVPPERGALTPFLLATLSDDQFYSGLHWYEEKAINWTYQ
jgi:carbonyl reductase 1